ncbi:phospholipase D-like domain-containing protein [Pseudomonas sp. NLJ1]|uniref:phospholipase D-like domain-containing protein n=1 Tax=Pseudomonas sp. NLJ1 TaxID=3086079 RepID=UPI003C6BEE27
MEFSTVVQPQRQLGTEIGNLLEARQLKRLCLVSAFVGLRAILRLRDAIIEQKENGAEVVIIVGIDLGGTTKEVLEELLRWGCKVYVAHNAVPRATFHPKCYIFEGENNAVAFVGSNNLTDGGMYSNYEVAAEYKFSLPADSGAYNDFLRQLSPITSPAEDIMQELTVELIAALVRRSQIPTQQEIGELRKRQRIVVRRGSDVPENPFPSVPTPRAPLLDKALRSENDVVAVAPEVNGEGEGLPPVDLSTVAKSLVWQKKLPATDSLQVKPGTKHVGGVRLVQAKFRGTDGEVIDQTTYFRELFDGYKWEREEGRHRKADQEHTFIAMRLVIDDVNYGVRNFEISHKPDGEAGQDNYTTILRWGRDLNGFIQERNITGKILRLYETVGDEADYLIDIRD